MEQNSKSPEQGYNELVREAWQQVAKDKMPVAEKYARKFGTTDGEASEEEIDELMKAFGVSKP